MARSDLWTREQLIMALNVYFKTVHIEPYLVAGSWCQEGSISPTGGRGYEDANGG